MRFRICISKHFINLAIIISMLFTSSLAFAANPTLTDLWNGQAEWVEEQYDIGSTDSFFSFPSMYWEGNEIWAFTDAAIGGLGITGGIKKSVSTDGINWSNETQVVFLGDKYKYEAEAHSYHLTLDVQVFLERNC